MSPIPALRLPPGKGDEPFIIPYLEGDVIEIPTSQSVIRMLVTGKETDNSFALVTAAGSQSEPIVFHYHNNAHDIFLCTHGQLNVWANDRARTLNPGDFASVPPGTIHRYQILGPHTEFWGPIVPGDWIEMFYAMGDAWPTDGPLYRTPDHRSPVEVLLPRIKNLPAEHDMVPVPHHPAIDPQPWESTDDTIAEGPDPYFIKADTGPRYAAAGLLIKPLIGLKQSHNRFAIARVEGSNRIPSKLPKLKYPSRQAITVVEGAFLLEVDEQRHELQTGQTAFIPSGRSTTFSATTRYASAYVTCDGVGFQAALEGVGTPYAVPIISEGFDRDPDTSEYATVFGNLGLY